VGITENRGAIVGRVAFFLLINIVFFASIAGIVVLLAD
jgi:hypothetical protein